MPLKTEDLFDLEGFAFADLFPPGFPPWVALDLMSARLYELAEAYADGKRDRRWRTLDVHNQGLAPEWRAPCHRPDLVLVAYDAIIEPHVYIAGPALIDEGAAVRHGATIRGPAIVGKLAVLGTNSELVRSILLPGAKAAHLNYVGDSIVGANANLGAGAVIANLRHDHRSVRVQGQETGRTKFGALVGDGAFITCNAKLNPGTLVPKAVMYPVINK